MANITYKCPTCGGDMGFDAATQSWRCIYCDEVFTLEQLDAAGRNTIDETKIEKHKELDEDEKATAVSTDGTIGKNLVQYKCSHCGAEIITDRATAATICVFCGNPIIMTEQIVGGFSPKYVIPFHIDKSKVMEEFKKFSKKPLTPKDFDCDKIVDKMQGIYLPFWLYSGHLSGRMTAEGVNKKNYQRNGNSYTDYEYYNVVRAGELDFANVPVDASSKTDNDAMDSIEPYDFKDLKPFNIGYLAGYLAERYDEDENTCRPRAEERMINTGLDELKKTCNYNEMTVRNYDHDLKITNCDYALMPAWLLYTKYKDKDYLFAMNGQTGKFIGNLPIDYVKLLLFSGIPGILAFIIMMILL